MCGLPQYTALELIDLSFEHGFVTVREPQNLDKPRKLSGEELSILIMGLDVVRTQITDPVKEQIAKDLQVRLKQLVESATANAILYADDRHLPYIEIINKALQNRIALNISYLNTSKDEITTRRILPLEVFQQGEEFLLLTWCYLSKANRTFAIARILSCDLISDTLPDSIADINLTLLPENSIVKIKFKYDRAALSFIENIQNRIVAIDQVAMIASVEVWDSEWILRNVLANAGHIKILAPVQFAHEVASRAKIALSNY
jgi:proteasome accessory factor C